MTLSEQETRWLRQAHASLASADVPTGRCPEVDDIWTATRGELVREQVRSLIEHTVECAACAEAWRLARDLGEEASLPEVAKPSGSWLRNRALLGAAAALLAVSVVALLKLAPASHPPLYREAEAPGIQSLIAENARLPRPRCLLRWSKAKPGARYNIQVATADLVVLARARGLEVEEYLVPETALGRIPAGGTLLWQVETELPDGTRSPSVTFISRLE